MLLPEGAKSDLRYLVWCFENKVTPDIWKNTPPRLSLIREAENYPTNYFAEAMGMETCFALPNMGAVVAPAKWRMVPVTNRGLTWSVSWSTSC